MSKGKGILNAVQNFLGGTAMAGLDKAAGIVDRFVHTKEEKEQVRLHFEELRQEQAKANMNFTTSLIQQFYDFINEHEGTANDLRQAGLLGRVILFARGCQRPLWGFFVMYIDFMWFSGAWKIEKDTQTEFALTVINLLVLGFLFGERAIKNIMPLYEKYMSKS